MGSTSRREREKRKVRRVDAKKWAEEQEKGFEPTAIKLPDGMEFYKPAKGIHIVDFMEYEVGDKNPAADEGYRHFEIGYTVHRVPTPNGQNTRFLCRATKNFGEKSCPICAWRNRHGGTASPELIYDLRPQIRRLWIINENPGDPKGPFKIFDAVHFNRGRGFGEMMKVLIESEDRDDFASLTDGTSVKLTIQEGSFKGKTFGEVIRVDFVQRKKQYDDALIEKMPCLDDMLIEPDAAQLSELLEGGATSDKKESAERNGTVETSRRSSRPRDEDDEDDEPDDEDASPLEDDEDDEPDDEDASPLEDDEDEEERPTKKKSSARDEDEEDDEPEDEDASDIDDEPADEDTSDLEDEDDEEEQPRKAVASSRKKSKRH